MSVENTISKVIYQGNGVAVEWPVPFAYSRADDIHLLHTDANGVETEIASNFRLNVNASGDSSVTYPVAGEPLPPGVRLTVYRKTPQTQIVDLQYGGAFSPETLEKDGFDRVVMMVQETREGLDRAVKVKLSASESPDDLRDSLFAARDQAQAASTSAGQSAAQAAGSAGEAAASAATATEQADRAKAEADRAQTAAENAEAIAGEATEITLGGVRLAPQAQAEAGTEDGAYAMTPLRTAQHLDAQFPGKFTAALNEQTSAASTANKIPKADGNGKLVADWLPAATNEQPGAVKLTSTPSPTDGNAAITPKGAHDTVVANAGKVSLLSTRSTTGDWTITGLTVGKPLIVLMSRGASVTTFAQLHIHSGAADGTSPKPSRGFILGHTSEYQASNTFACVPTENTVTLKINYLVGGAVLRAYQ